MMARGDPSSSWLPLVFAAALVVVLRGVPADAAEYMLPMRDGVKLHTYVDFPLSGKTSNLTCIMDRSPYGANHLELIADIYLLMDLVAVRQDMRGTHESEGKFRVWHTAGDDAYDTMEWLTSQAWSDGRVFTVGASADGIAQFCDPQNKPKWLGAQFIIFATGQGREVIYPGGAFRKSLVQFWLEGTVPKQAAALVQEIRANEAPGAWWNKINDTDAYQNVDFPSVMWAGWYDIFLSGNLAGFYGYQQLAAPSSRGKAKIVIDPLGHCQDAHVYFPKNLIEGRVLLPLFMSFDLFKGTAAAEGVKDVTFYVMGSTDADSPGNYWTSLDTFPTFKPTSLYLSTDGKLESAVPSAVDSTTYTFDPANPVPSHGGNNLKIKCGPLDQNATEARPDVLVFSSSPLGAALPVTGPLLVELYVSSSAVDTDFTAKLIDHYPEGTSRLIQDGIIRMRWREERDHPTFMKKGEVYKVTVSLWNTSYVFPKGHQIRLHVSSSNYPRFDVNPNNGLPLIQNGTAVVADNTIHHGSKYPSRLILPEVSLDQMPEVHLLMDHEKMLRTWLDSDSKVQKGAELLDRFVRSQLQEFASRV